MKVPKINFIDMECLPELEDDFLYVAIVYDANHDVNGYETLRYSSQDEEFLIWDGEDHQYIYMSEDQHVMSIAKLSKYGDVKF